MALIVEAVGQSGVVERISVEGGAAVINAQPGLTYRILDESGRPLNASATVRRVGDHLIIEGLPGEATVQLNDFFFVCTPNDPCSLDLEGLGGVEGETISQVSEPVAALADGSFVLHAPESMATPTAPEAEFSGKPALAGLALLALAGGGGGGGGGGSDGPPPPPAGSTTVTSPPFTNDTTPVIAGKAVPGAQITVTLDIPGSGPVTFNTVADGNGDWSIDTGSATPIAGAMPAAGLPLDAPTTVRVLTAGSTEPITYQLSMDLVPPAAPVIQAVTGDDLINADEAREANPSPVTVQGTAEPGSAVTVSWHGDDQVTTADAEGNWAVTFNGQEIPDGDYIISAVATDVAGNTGAASTRPVTVATGRPSVPNFDDVAGDNIINADESGGDLVIRGTTSAGTEVLVSFGEVVIDRQATVTGTDWSVTITAAELAQLQDGQTYQATAYASDGVNRSVVGASDPVVVDRTPPAAPSITNPGEAADGIVNAAEAADGVTIAGTAEAGGRVQVSWGGVTLPSIDVDVNGNWTAVFGSSQVPADGNHTISVTAFDAAGNASPTPAELPVQVDTTVATPTFELASDTGRSGNDGITMNGAINIAGLESGGNWEYSVDSGVTWNPGSGTGFTLPPGAYATNAVQVRQTDAAGNVSDARGNPTDITVDNIAPVAPSVSLTAPNVISVDGIEADASWDYRIDNGIWTPGGAGSSFVLPDGIYAPNAIQVRQTDAAGNESPAGGNSAEIVVDLTPPDAPTITFEAPNIIQVGAIEAGASWDYRIDNGIWTPGGAGSNFVLPDGIYAPNAIQVRQTDAAGNESAAGGNSAEIVVDLTPPDAPTITFEAPNIIHVGGIEADASWDYRIDNGIWTPGGAGSSFVLPDGIYAPNAIQVRQTDAAGNESPTTGNPITISVIAPGGFGDDAFPALMSLDLSVPEFLPGDGRVLSIDKFVDDALDAPSAAVANGGIAGDSTPMLTLTLSDVLGPSDSVRLLRDGAMVATSSEPRTASNLDDGAGIIAQEQYSYTAQPVTAGDVIPTSDPHLYNFQMI